MPAKSKSQQRLFGMVHAYQKGKLKNAPESIKAIASGISEEDAKHFAETKHKGLPEKKAERLYTYLPKGNTALIEEKIMNSQISLKTKALQKIAAFATSLQLQRPPGTPIGYWNNNPGNLLSDGRTLWNGAKKVQSKGANLEFSDYGSGYRAMARTLYNYKAKYGLDTLQAILARYAKSATAAKRVAYEKFIRFKTGWKPGDKIDLTNTDTLHQLVPAMAAFEIGPKFTAYHDPSVVSNAVIRAIPPK